MKTCKDHIDYADNTMRFMLDQLTSEIDDHDMDAEKSDGRLSVALWLLDQSGLSSNVQDQIFDIIRKNS